MSRVLVAAAVLGVVAAALWAWPRGAGEAAAATRSPEPPAAEAGSPQDPRAPSLAAADRPTAPLPTELAAEDLGNVDGLRERRRARFASEAARDAERLLAEADGAPLDPELLVRARAAARELRDPGGEHPR